MGLTVRVHCALYPQVHHAYIHAPPTEEPPTVMSQHSTAPRERWAKGFPSRNVDSTTRFGLVWCAFPLLTMPTMNAMQWCLTGCEQKSMCDPIESGDTHPTDATPGTDQPPPTHCVQAKGLHVGNAFAGYGGGGLGRRVQSNQLQRSHSGGSLLVVAVGGCCCCYSRVQ